MIKKKKNMLDFDHYLRYGSENVDKLKVNVRINMNYPKQKFYFGVSQRVIEVTDALVCKDLWIY